MPLLFPIGMVKGRETTESAEAPSLRVLTYNVHGCRGTDGKIDPARIAAVIERCDADIVGLQEVDVARARSGGMDQAEAIAAHLRMSHHFHPALHLAEERYGDAILTRLPARHIKSAVLPSTGEPRGAIWMSVEFDGAEINVINTHLGLRRSQRIAQINTLLGPTWIGKSESQPRPLILMGDFNAVPSSTAYRTLRRTFCDVQRIDGRRARATFPSRLPIFRLDHIFIDDALSVVDAEVPTTPIIRTASDHLPLVATLSLRLK
jgi:endonuclease/exonuclease/phosphatase family metal-dependent hydrolase